MIAAAVNGDALVAGFKPDGVLAQIQAQAYCTAQVGFERRVMAVHRSPIGTKPNNENNGKLEPYGAECKTVCANQTNPWNVAMTHVASFGIYDAPPFTAADGAVQRSGLITHRFHPDEDGEGFFGPNYCCCSG